MEVSKPTSLEALLREKYEAQIIKGQRLIAEAESHLAKIAIIYGGQLHFELEGQDVLE